MHIKSLILATALALLAAPVAFADPLSTLESCNGCAMSVQDYDAAVAARDARDNPPIVDDGDSGETYVPPVDEPTEPEEPAGPTPGVHPDHPEGNGYEVTFVGTVFEGFPAGTYTQIFAPAIPQYDFPGGVIDAVVRADGTATVWVISYGLPGQSS